MVLHTRLLQSQEVNKTSDISNVEFVEFVDFVDYKSAQE